MNLTGDNWRKDFWQLRRYDCAAILVITLFFLLFFWPLFRGDKFFVMSDAFVYSYPLRTVVWNSIRHGHLPLWTPLIMSGYPLLSMAQIGIGYPLTWSYLFLPGRWAEELYVLAPFLLFPCFIYAYCREIHRSRMASVLAALTFGYSGAMVSSLANVGMHTNALMWLPLVLIAIERARRGRTITSLIGATAGYVMTVLTGYGQGIAIVGGVALVYGLFVSIAGERLRTAGKDDTPDLLSWKRWRPFAVSLGAVALSSGVSAFQIMETLRAQRHSIRSTLTYDIFTSMSFAPGEAVASFVTPLHHIVDTTAYVAPLSCAIAAVGLWFAIRKRTRDLRLMFWLVFAVAAFVLMFGSYIPLYRLLYHVPVINLFRAPARHAFEFAFALSILSAYGWDAAREFLPPVANRIDRWLMPKLAIGIAVWVGLAVLWYLDLAKVPLAVPEWYYRPPLFSELRYVFWKLPFAGLAVYLLWQSWRISKSSHRNPLQLCIIGIACFVEPSLFASRYWWPKLKSARQFTDVSAPTRFLQRFPPAQNRVYTRTSLWWEEMAAQRRLEPTNLSMLHGLHNVAGYEPLILERYSRALGNVFLDAVYPRPGYQPDNSILESRSHVLDLLNTELMVSYFDSATEPYTPVEKEGIRFGDKELIINLRPGETASLPGVAAESDTLAIASTLSFSKDVGDGELVAKVRLIDSHGRVVEREILAGRDTAEWAHERPDLRSVIRHRLAQVFDVHPSGDAENSFSAYRYWTKVSFGEPLRIARVEFVNVAREAGFHVIKATLFDSRTQFSMPLPHYDLNKWQPVYDQNNVVILRNRSALPRLWLVAEAEAVDGEEALSRIRGESDRSFDPRRTALLEIRPENLPQLPGGTVSPQATANLISYTDNQIEVATSAQTPTILVLSEINYPGWVATVDGVKTPIHTADFLLRGMILPVGSHRVEMHYTAPGARYGAMISLFSLLLVAGLGVYAHRARRKAGPFRAASDS